jgi:hypothetical protein
LIATALLCAPSRGDVVVQDRVGEGPMVLNEPQNYVLKNVKISGLADTAALTIEGRVRSITMENCRFGDVLAGPNGRAAAVEAVHASVGKLTVSDSAFFDAENQLVSLRDGRFGTVTFSHCSFKTSDAFLKKVYANNSWRTTPPITEFYNIERLELLDNEFFNTTIVIHPSVKTVVLRGDFSRLRVESPETQVIRVGPGLPESTPFAFSQMGPLSFSPTTAPVASATTQPNAATAGRPALADVRPPQPAGFRKSE